MISITEIILIVAGFAAIILGYLLPAGKDMDEEDKVLMEKEIRELVRREVEGQKDTIEEMVGDTVDNSLDRTERAMERLSNEKLSEINEYSDTVINDINKNHEEVMFMYDMLNDKHKNLTSVVSEVTKRADEAKQVVRDAEATAKEAQEFTNSLKLTENENLRAILLDEAQDKPAGIRIPYTKKAREQEPVPGPEPISQYVPQPQTTYQTLPQQQVEPSYQNIQQPQPVPMQVTPQPDPVAKPVYQQRSGYVDEKNLPELEGLEEIPAEYLSSDQLSGLHVIGGNSEASETSAKVVPITEALRVESRPKNPDTSMQELIANDPASQNKQILEMHKAGKSNMVIARELGLGIGEVKLVIDLNNKHRKVR